MFRTLGILVAGIFLSLLLIAGDVYLLAYVIPQRFYTPLSLLFMLAIGPIVGAFTGLLERRRAGVVAVLCCSLPLLYGDVLPPYSYCTWFQPLVLLLIQASLCALAFVVADRLSQYRKRQATNADLAF